MQSLIRLFAGLLLAGLLGACAGPVPKIDATQASLSKINTITVIRPPRKGYTVMNLSSPAMAFGLIGGVILAADANSKQGQLTAVLDKENLSVPAALTDRLLVSLAKNGYRPLAADGPWEEKDGKYSIKYEAIRAETDAVMVVIPTVVGFVDAGVVNNPGSDYLPTIATVIVLLDKDHKTILYRGYHVTGWKLHAEGWRHTPAKVKYPYFSDLMKTPAETAAALVDASDLIAISVGADLRRDAPPVAAAPGADSSTQGTAPPRQP